MARFFADMGEAEMRATATDEAVLDSYRGIWDGLWAKEAIVGGMGGSVPAEGRISFSEAEGMANSAIQAFDFGRSGELRSQIKGAINDIDATLNQMQTAVEGCREWWKGGSEERFIANFKNAKAKVRKGLQEWLAGNEKLMRDVEKAKRDSDAALTYALKK
jgi:uncharacterized protein YukE